MPLPDIKFEMINFALATLLDRAPLPKRRAPKNDADWCNRFVQNSHGEPIGDKTDYCQICNFASGELSGMSRSMADPVGSTSASKESDIVASEEARRTTLSAPQSSLLASLVRRGEREGTGD